MNSISLWLNLDARHPGCRAQRAEHSVQVLLKGKAKCIDGQDEVAKPQIGPPKDLCRRHRLPSSAPATPLSARGDIDRTLCPRMEESIYGPAITHLRK